MENSRPLSSFMALADFDQTANQNRLKIEKAVLELSSLQQQANDLTSQLEDSAKTVFEAQKIVHEHELIMQELESELKKQKGLLDQTISPKEHNALKSAISQIRQVQHQRETELIEAWNHLEHAKLQDEQNRKLSTQQLEELQTKINEKTDATSKLKQELASLLQQRQNFLHNLPTEWLAKYEGMYTKVSNPIVQLTDGICSACFQPATPQIILNLKKQQLMQCQGCYRFLFFTNSSSTRGVN